MILSAIMLAMMPYTWAPNVDFVGSPLGKQMWNEEEASHSEYVGDPYRQYEYDSVREIREGRCGAPGNPPGGDPGFIGAPGDPPRGDYDANYIGVSKEQWGYIPRSEGARKEKK